MGTLFDMKAFFRFLEEATDQELLTRYNTLKGLIDSNSFTGDTLCDAQYYLKKIESTLLNRQFQ